MYVNRFYRDEQHGKDLKSFRMVVKETDLHIQVDQASWREDLLQKAEKIVLALRYDLETYIKSDPEFRTSLQPHAVKPGAPPIARTMADAAKAAGVGPMAAVAGTFAEFVGHELLKYCHEVIVENGGDVFLAAASDRLAAVFAGTSPFSNRLAVEIPADRMPLGICTSSGTVGPSLSFGKADAAVVIAVSAGLADAAATAAGNAVRTPGEVKKGIRAARKIQGVSGILIIKDDQMAVWGDFRIVPLANPPAPGPR